MSLFGRLFRRPRDVRSDAGVWRRGELAVCVLDDWSEKGPISPKVGDVLRVSGVEDAAFLGVRTYFLSFVGRPANWVWDARAFRKAIDDRAPAEAEFAALIKQPGERRRAPLPSPTDAPAVVAASAVDLPASPGDPDHA